MAEDDTQNRPQHQGTLIPVIVGAVGLASGAGGSLFVSGAFSEQPVTQAQNQRLTDILMAMDEKSSVQINATMGNFTVHDRINMILKSMDERQRERDQRERDMLANIARLQEAVETLKDRP